MYLTQALGASSVSTDGKRTVVPDSDIGATRSAVNSAFKAFDNHADFVKNGGRRR